MTNCPQCEPFNWAKFFKELMCLHHYIGTEYAFHYTCHKCGAEMDDCGQ